MIIKSIFPAIILGGIIVFTSCKTEGTWQKTSSGLEYKLVNDNPGPNAQKDEFVDLQMQYRTPKDSIVFNSFTRPRPLNFKITENLFRGALYEPLTMMSPGDSALFKIPASKVFGDRVPNYIRAEDYMTFLIRMDTVRTADEHRIMREAEKAKQAELQPASTAPENTNQIIVTPNTPVIPPAVPNTKIMPGAKVNKVPVASPGPDNKLK